MSAEVIPAEGQRPVDVAFGNIKVDIKCEIGAVYEPVLSCSELAKTGTVSTFGDGWGCLRLPNRNRVNLIPQDGVYYLEVVLCHGLAVRNVAVIQFTPTGVGGCHANASATSGRLQEQAQATKEVIVNVAGFEYWRQQAAVQAATFRRQ